MHIMRETFSLFLVMTTLLAGSVSAQLSESDFTLGDEGWTTAGNGGAPVQHFGDFITQQDIDADEMAFVAPPAFVSNVAAGYRGELSFELMTSQQAFAPSRPKVRLSGTTSAGSLTLEFLLASPLRANVFHSYRIGLVETQPWEVVGEARAPTAAEFREVMGGLTNLQIIGDAQSAGDDYIAIDSVRLDPARVRVYILAGQSNMSGCNDVRNLDPTWQDTLYEPMLYWDMQSPNPGFLPLTPGTSTASCSNPAPEFYFGPELSFGRELVGMYPSEQVLLIKYAVGGTNLYADWTTPTGEFPMGGPLWNQLKLTIDTALNDLLAMGYEYQIDGFLWMQGESDGDKQFRANAYQTKLTNFIASMRSHTGRPDMPFVLGRVRNAGQPHIQKVRDAQVAVASADPNTCWFDTDDLPWLPDGIHYDDPSMITLGQRFADRLSVFLDPLGDVNRDGKADIDDLYEWTQNPVDLNCDGVANQADMDIVINAVRAAE